MAATHVAQWWVQSGGDAGALVGDILHSKHTEHAYVLTCAQWWDYTREVCVLLLVRLSCKNLWCIFLIQRYCKTHFLLVRLSYKESQWCVVVVSQSSYIYQLG